VTGTASFNVEDNRVPRARLGPEEYVPPCGPVAIVPLGLISEAASQIDMREAS